MASVVEDSRIEGIAFVGNTFLYYIPNYRQLHPVNINGLRNLVDSYDRFYSWRALKNIINSYYGTNAYSCRVYRDNSDNSDDSQSSNQHITRVIVYDNNRREIPPDLRRHPNPNSQEAYTWAMVDVPEGERPTFEEWGRQSMLEYIRGALSDLDVDLANWGEITLYYPPYERVSSSGYLLCYPESQ